MLVPAPTPAPPLHPTTTPRLYTRVVPAQQATDKEHKMAPLFFWLTISPKYMLLITTTMASPRPCITLPAIRLGTVLDRLTRIQPMVEIT